MAARQYPRQVATIISIDAVGFSRLMGIDDEATVATFEQLCKLIDACCAERGGRLFGPAGDSMMAEFGSPIDALLAALEFQERIRDHNASLPAERRMSFRVGINTGSVIIRDQSRYGDDVNIAARLQEIAPEGGVVISNTTWQHVWSRAAVRFVDLGQQSFHNILLPVHAYRVERSAGEPAPPPPPANPPFSFFRADGKGGPPAIAVLPLRSEPDDPETRYIGEGIAEDIIAGLSNVRWLPVIAVNSSQQFKDAAVPAETAGRALGARYVVTGTLIRMGSRIRVRAMLDDASTNRTIWSRSYEHDMTDMFDMQGEIGSAIVGTLEKEVDRVEQARTFRVPWESLETWQLVRRGRWHMQRRTSQDTARALEFFQAAYERDPNSSTVLDELAWWYFWRSWRNFGENSDYREDLDRVVDYSRRALYVDSQDARPHAYLGITDIMLQRSRSALDHLSESLRINPSFAFARSAMGSAHNLLGEPERAIPLFQGAERLSPFDLYRFHNLGELASAQCLVGDWDRAVATADRSLTLAPSYWYARFLKIGALARLGRHEDACTEKTILLAQEPGFTSRRAEWIPFVDRQRNRTLIEAFDAVEDRASPRHPAM